MPAVNGFTMRVVFCAHCSSHSQKQMKTATREEFLTVPQVAKELGISARRAQQFCQEGRLGRRVGPKHYVISREELDEFKKLPRKPGPAKGTRKGPKQISLVCEAESGPTTIGEWIRQQREARGWLQRELAYKIGAYQPDISYYENGTQIPEAQVCKVLAAVFDADFRDVLRLAAETNYARQL